MCCIITIATERWQRGRVWWAMTTARDYLELALHHESEATKAKDKFSRYQLLSFAESYRTLAESAAALDRSAKALETIDMLRRARGG